LVRSSDVTKIARQLAEPILPELGLELVDVEFKSEGGAWFLRFFIDKPGGVNLDDCQAFSEKVGKELDAVDPIPQSYHLEVSSPGAERPLTRDQDFVRFAGANVSVKTFAPYEGRRNWEGELVGKGAEGVTILEDGRKVTIPADLVAHVRLAVKF
jgi:ribosome maturation factor RimP